MKANFKMKFFANGNKEVEFGFSNMFYGVEQEFAENVVLGICIGMRAKYKHPRVELYKVTEDGNEVLVREQR